MAWNEFLEKLAELRQKPDFDEQERVYKLEIAERLVDALNRARDGEDYQSALQSAFRAHFYDGQLYNLTGWRQNEWLLNWARQDESRVREVLAGFLRVDMDARSRFEAFSGAAEEAELSDMAPRNRAATLAFGSLFNFAVEPLGLPLVRTLVFDAAERAVAANAPTGRSVADDYGHHLAFAERTGQRLRDLGVPIRDMLDVQSLLFLYSYRPRAADEVDRSEDVFAVELTEGALRNANLSVSKGLNLGLFPADSIGPPDGSASKGRLLTFLPEGAEPFESDISQDKKLIRSQVGPLFRAWNAAPGDEVIISRLTEDEFRLQLRRAQGLGVSANPRPASVEARVWCNRAGEEGQSEGLALEHGVAVIGWHELGPITPELSRDDLKTMIERVSGESRPQSLASQAGQIFRFINDVSVGDLVVLPLKTNPGHVAIGRVLGEYEYRSDGPFDGSDARNTRAVEWLAKDLAYKRFEPDLREAFGQQGTLSEITKPNAVQRILEVLDGADASAIHLVVKWSERFGANTADEHRRVADEHGAVWWGLIGSADGPKLGQKWMDKISAQLGDGRETDVFILGPSCWSTTLRDIAGPEDTIDEDLLPSSYPGEYQHKLWVKIANFEPIDRSWLTEHLELVSTPGAPLTEGALKNQTNPLIVHRVAGPRAHTARVWWVCQGQTYASARDLGVLWAPKTARDGSGRAHWRALTDAHAGDLVIHYSDNHIRAVSTVSDEAIDAPRPPRLRGDWVEGDGWLVTADYRELEEPIALSEIPIDWRVAEQGPFTKQGVVRQGYFFPLSDRFANQIAELFPQLGLGSERVDGAKPVAISYVEPTFEEIEAAIGAVGLQISVRNLRRYHVSLKTRGFVVLAGVSGSGKTWLAEAYAEIVGAEQLRVPVAPNWTTNEDLLGYLNPIDGQYRHTDFSRFLQRAAAEYSAAQGADRDPRPFYLIFDEMNLARVEYYFAKFLSAMEARARYGTAPIVLADDLEVQLTPNLKFIGTVNVDETTFGFADKVYDRAQLIELDAPWEMLAEHLQDKPFRDTLHAIWDAVHDIAPFAFRVVDEVNAYVGESALLGVSWQEAVDDQLLQKVLPKIKGTDPRIRDALEAFLSATDESFTLSHEKARSMLAMFNTHGFVSYF